MFIAEGEYLQYLTACDADADALEAARPVIIARQGIIIQGQGQMAPSQWDTLDLSPGAQVDMRAVPADMVPGK